MKKLLINKYKPKIVNDLILDDVILKYIDKIVLTKKIPNSIFFGDCGTSKTTSLQCIIKELYPNNNSIMEFKTFNDRGIKINEKINIFCKQKIIFEEKYSQHRLIIFDDADNISIKTQKIICSNIDKYQNCSFVFICNKLTSIDETIKSRCNIKHFKTNINFIQKIQYICINENIKYDIETLTYLYNIANKDYRMIINMLDLIINSNTVITKNIINDLFGIPKYEIFEKLLNAIFNKDYSTISKLIIYFNSDGIFSFDVLYYFINFIIHYDKINEDQKIFLIDILSKKAFSMNTSICNNIQLTSAIFSCIEFHI